jgi:iron complex transport system ATP-binding protein
MLSVSGLSFAFGTQRVLQDVSLNVPTGGMVGLLGPNGCGKTTLIRLLAGALTPASGTIAFDGTPIVDIDRRSRARRIAVVPQQTQLAFDYTVQDVALMGRYPHLGPFELEGPDDLAAAHDALASTGTADLSCRPFNTLSGGEQQRVAIASALAQLDRRAGGHERGGRLLLLDEPTASLDLKYQVEIASLIGQLHDEAQHTDAPLSIITSTHDLRFAATVCRAVVLMNQGRVVASGPPGDVLTPATVAAVYGLSEQQAAPLLPGVFA